MSRGMVKVACLLLAWAIGSWSGVAAEGAAEKSPARVLVVMSYEAYNRWTVMEREGIAQALSGCEVEYFYLNTKQDQEGGWARGREAFALMQKFHPDAVIAVDDNAQEMFVLPYLKDKTTLPVVFCGVNDDAIKYGYPATNVTGILEIKHYAQTISFARMVIKDLRKLAVIYKKTSSNEVNLAQIKREMADYPVEVVDFLSVSSLVEAKAVLDKIRGSVQAVLVLNLSGIVDDRGQPMDGGKAITELRDLALPMISTQDYAIEAGALCGVVQSGREQGIRAGEMVRGILGGKKPGDIPVARNLNGQRYLNLTTARLLDLSLDSDVVMGSMLLR